LENKNTKTTGEKTVRNCWIRYRFWLY